MRSGHWKGGQIPKLEWEYDVRRHTPTGTGLTPDTILSTLIPNRGGPADLPSFTAFDSASRSYFASSWFNQSAAHLFTTKISAAVDSASAPTSVYFAFPKSGAIMIGLKSHSNADGSVQLLALFESGEVIEVNPATGVTAPFASMVPSATPHHTLSSAIAVNSKTGTLLGVTDNKRDTSTPRLIVSVDLLTGDVKNVPLTTLKYHDPTSTTPFQAVWLEGVQQLLVFYAGFETGDFDQIIFASPATGAMVLMWRDLTQVPTIAPPPYPGQVELTFQAHCKTITTCIPAESDFLQTVTIDRDQGTILFQGTIQNSEGPGYAVRMLTMPIPTKVHECMHQGLSCTLRTAADTKPPYGWAGYQYVEVVANTTAL